MIPLRIEAYTATSTLGRGTTAHLEALREGRSGLRPCPADMGAPPCWIGEVAGLDPVAEPLEKWDCRNNRLAQLGLEQDDFSAAVARAAFRHGPHRVGVFIGTSTSGIAQTERAFREITPGTNTLPGWFDFRRTHNIGALAEFVRQYLRLEGPAFSVSTACSSSAKVFASAHRAIQLGICDAAVVGGVDSLCLTTLHGFASLQVLSADICRPADAQRNGISIGEAAGFALLETIDGSSSDSPRLIGYGESSDAYHMSAPDPEGQGAARAMRLALQRGGLKPHDVDYINLHGTGTQANDLSEDRAVADVFGSKTLCSSTKAWTGHTLGAAGILEAVLVILCLKHNLVPGSLSTRLVDPRFQTAIQSKSITTPLRYAVSNSFGFGGSNCSLLFGSAL